MVIQPWPFTINIFKGEGRLLIIPVVKHDSGFFVDSDWFVNIQDVNSYREIGSGVIDAINIIKESPRSIKDLKEQGQIWAWQKNSKYKSWISFWKNNFCTRIKYYEDGHYEVYSLVNSRTDKGAYSEIAKKIILSKDSKIEEVGKSVLEVFAALAECHGDNVSNKEYTSKYIELLDGSKISIIPPKEKNISDDEDCNTAEIYQCYSYYQQGNAISSAEIFLGIASELECNLEISNVHNSWEDIYGKTDFFDMKEIDYGIFKFRAEMQNKNSHRISYFLQMTNDLLLECGMDVHQPNKRKKIDEKLSKVFEEFALSCQWYF